MKQTLRNFLILILISAPIAGCAEDRKDTLGYCDIARPIYMPGIVNKVADRQFKQDIVKNNENWQKFCD